MTDALQLCSLLLPQSNRTRLHRILRLIYKASTNPQLHLSKTQSNKDVLLGQFASIILRSDSKLSRIEEEERRSVEKLVSFMAQHYQQIFKVGVTNCTDTCKGVAFGNSWLLSNCFLTQYHLGNIVSSTGVYYHVSTLYNAYHGYIISFAM